MTGNRIEGADLEPLLAVRGLAISIGDKCLVRDLDFDVLPGQRWCVLGPNGSGKTTLLHVIAGLRNGKGGDIRLRGVAYDAMSPREAALRRAILLQGRHFVFGSSVQDCVMLGRHPHIGRFNWPASSDAERVQAALATMDLCGLADRDVTTLSGGEQQRTHLATFLAQEAPLLLLDEPTTHLDLKHQFTLFSHLHALCERDRCALVFSTHELSIATRFATHVLLLTGEGSVHRGECTRLLNADLLSAVFGFPIVGLETDGGKRFMPQW